MTRRRWLIPYLLLAPGMLWLLLFFVLPNIQMFLMSLSTQAGGIGLTRQYEFSWAWRTTSRRITDFPRAIRQLAHLTAEWRRCSAC